MTKNTAAIFQISMNIRHNSSRNSDAVSMGLSDFFVDGIDTDGLKHEYSNSSALAMDFCGPALSHRYESYSNLNLSKATWLF